MTRPPSGVFCPANGVFRPVTLPSVEQVEAECNRVRRQRRRQTTLKRAAATLAAVAGVAVLVAVLWLPVLQVWGSSMTPTLTNGEIVLSVKTSQFDSGDVIAFRFNNNVLVKRVIARPGEWVNIDADGSVTVNGVRLDEPYVSDPSLGECDIELPYQVPDGRFFVMGDHRSTSVDSRSTTLGCVSQEQVVGKIVCRLWPLGRVGIVE